MIGSLQNQVFHSIYIAFKAEAHT